jgi:hypothetical protein
MLRKFGILLVVVSTLGLITGCEEDGGGASVDVTGTWTLHMYGQTTAMHLVQHGSEVSNTGTTRISGSVSGDDITMAFNITEQFGSMTKISAFALDGTVNGGHMSGTVTRTSTVNSPGANPVSVTLSDSWSADRQ